MLFSPPTPPLASRQRGKSPPKQLVGMLPRMSKRRLFIYVQVALVFALALYLTFGSRSLTAAPGPPGIPAVGGGPFQQTTPNAAPTKPPASSTTVPTEHVVTPEEKKVKDDEDRGKTAEEIEKDFERAKKNKKLVQAYIPVIMNPDDRSVKRLLCPKFNESRYDHLKPSNEDRKKRYFFAINLKQCEYILPRLLGSLVEVIRFLGVESSVLSVVEGNSDDGTSEVLAALAPELEAAGITYFYLRSDISPNDGNRIGRLAELRNKALEPMLNSRKTRPLASKRSASVVHIADPAAARRQAILSRARKPAEPWGADLEFADDTVVNFVNDVAICPDDILELLHQRKIQDADMTCGMDWSHMQNWPTFYDQWVARQINGDSFFDIPDDGTGSWDNARYLFTNDELTRTRFVAGRPFHVFACWNGAVAFRAEPIMSKEVRFRDGREGECRMGEPTYFCKDLWSKGYGKIAVVPTVNLEYDDDHGAQIKLRKGFVSDWTKKEHREKVPMQIPWQPAPEKILCMPSFVEQSWIPWNDTFA